MNLWRNLETGPKPPEQIHVIVEIPKGSKVKYKFKQLKGEWYLSLDKMLYSPLFYAGNYGIIPKTMGFGGHALDCLVLMDEPIPPETVITARPVAILEMVDEGIRDDKIVAVALEDPETEKLKELNDINKKLRDQITEFFSSYKRIEGRKIEVIGWRDAESARKAVKHAQKVFIERPSQ